MAGAVILLSGGLDSTTVAAIARRDEGPLASLAALSFDYGQRHRRELDSARDIAARYDMEHTVLAVPQLGRSALTDTTVDLPRSRGLAEMAARIPSTYVPCRNLVLLAITASLAEARGITRIYGGWNQIDFSGYADCRREFLAAFTRTLNVGTKIATEGERSWEIIAPLLMLGKKQIIQLGLLLHAPYALTWSCYEGGERPCGTCDACVLRAAGFAEVGAEDPALHEHARPAR